MVGVVLVSHNQKLVEGLQELVTQLNGQQVAVAVAGGGPKGEIGTCTDKIRRAIGSVLNPDGVVILVDMGSAALSTEEAIAALGTNLPGKIHLSSAPLVEGAIMATMHSSMGDNLASVLEAVEEARTMPKNID